MPLEATGLYIVELESPRLGAALLRKPQSRFVPTSVLVTNLAVHFKWEKEASLVWVTTLDEGRPAPEAQVSVYDCLGKVLWSGQTDAQGIARMGKLPPPEALADCPDDGNLYHFDYKQTMAINSLDGGLFVSVSLDHDFSYTHSSWDRGIEPWRFQLPLANQREAIIAHTILDRSLFRAGDTVHMEHLLREQTLGGFALVAQEQLPNRVSIHHVGSEETNELPLLWEGGAVAESAWAIPKGAKLGSYQIVLSWQATKQRAGKPDAEEDWISGEFPLEAFRVPLMRGIIQPSTEPPIGISELSVEVAVKYLAGWGAGHLVVALRSQIRPKSVHFPDVLEGFTFANQRLKEDIVRRSPGTGTAGEAESDDAVISASMPASTGVHQRLDVVLDEAGMARATITPLPKLEEPADLLLELGHRGQNGETQTVATSIPLWPSKWLVGVKAESWVASKGTISTQIAVLDVYGQSGQAIIQAWPRCNPRRLAQTRPRGAGHLRPQGLPSPRQRAAACGGVDR